MGFVEAVTLAGRYATLEPLALEHEDEIRLAVTDGELWKLWFTMVPRPEEVRGYIEGLLAQRELGEAFAFAVRDTASGRIVGGTRYLHIDAAHRRLEIGGTWYAQSVQRTGVNTECKRLLLEYCFETLGANRVQLRAKADNGRSRRAIEKIGAVFEGVLRQDKIEPSGKPRDTALYSIVREEWPAVKGRLFSRTDPVSR